ncbi:hypothetical protein NONO_c17740 [Nocardia nova SH22a]|uniref:Uncharacterized protein n=1 Tax=Nocardia nova SH22a TaxID=1415166 RepID=W5TBN4_9NOCA|nr:hypothetical protein [Nocardia nova]AHH16574.1 hypothetical protein NONO_c17740 [Nocardia nova SH22a]
MAGVEPLAAEQVEVILDAPLDALLSALGLPIPGEVRNTINPFTRAMCANISAACNLAAVAAHG